jgi:hypothetical protein
VLRRDGDYARTRQIWNRVVENQPALLAMCETSADVQAAVRVARAMACRFRYAAVDENESHFVAL